MTKELTALLILTVIVISSWIGWLVFERNSILSEVDFSQKTIQVIDPALKIEVLE